MRKIKWKTNKANGTVSGTVGRMHLMCHVRDSTTHGVKMWESGDALYEPCFQYREGRLFASLDECKEGAIQLARKFLMEYFVGLEKMMKSFGMEIDDE